MMMGAEGMRLLLGGAMLYGLALVALIALISMLRQYRAWRIDHLALAVVPAAASTARTQPDAPRPPRTIQHPRPVMIPSYLPLPVREAAPELTVFQIDVPDGPNRDQRAVQRLIDYLKAEALRAERLHAG